MKKKTKLEKKNEAVADAIGVKVRQLYRYLGGLPVPSKRVYLVKGALGGTTDLWVQPKRSKEKKKLFREYDCGKEEISER